MGDDELSDEQLMKMLREMSPEQRRDLCEKARDYYASAKPKLKLVCDSENPKKGGE